MKFNVQIDNYNTPSKSVTYSNANVSYVLGDRRMNILTKEIRLCK